MIDTVLWDVDGTLLDFDAAERAAIRTLFTEFGLGECTDEMLARYHEINVGFWQRLEKGELSRPEVLLGRFEQFFGEYGIDPKTAPAFNERYQLTLGDTIVFHDDSINIVNALKGKVRQYVVSNGTVAAQTKKLRLSGIGELMDGVFLSEEIGVEKPDPAFFEKVLSRIRPCDLSAVMIVGDSLTSDMRGGINAGIKTCWYNPEKKPLPSDLRIDHVISDLNEVLPLLGAANEKDAFEKRTSPTCGDTGTVRAVIFDLDGTLTDTEKYFQRAWAEAGERSGFELDREKTLALRSLGMPFVDGQLKKWFGEACRPAEIRALTHSIFNSIAAEHGVRLKPGAKELLAWLKAKGVVIALATAGSTDRAEKQLAETGVRGFFDKVISANMVARGKPAPDTYLHACSVLGVRPEEAVAVEDSPNGVKSACAAGCRVIMVPDQTEPDGEIKPMLFACVNSLGDIIGLV